MPASNAPLARADCVRARTRSRARMLAALNPSAASPWLQAPHSQTKPAPLRSAWSQPRPPVIPQPLRNESAQPDAERRMRMRTLAAT